MIDMKVKQLFFDSKKIMQSIARAERKVMMRQGAYVRTASRSLIRKSKKVSSPGQPPRGHTGLLRKHIYFAYEPATKSIVVGPAKLNQVDYNANGKPINGVITEVLEEGGTIGIREVQRNGKWRRADMRSKRRLSGQKTRLRKVKIAPRPYMKVGLNNAKKDLEKSWKDSVKNG